MGFIRKVFEFKLRIIGGIASIFIAISTILASINVFLRYLFGSSLPWADELSIYIIVMMVYIYQCKLEYDDDQLSISVLAEYFRNKPVILKSMYYVRMVVTVSLYGMLLNTAFKVVQQHWMYKGATPVMRMPFWILGLIVTIGLILVILAWIVKFLPEKKNKDTKKEGEQIG